MSEGRIIQIRKKGGLEKIAKTRNGVTLQPLMYNTKTRSKREEGQLEGEYKGKTIIDTKHFLAPIWNDIKKQWSWGGTPQDLARLIAAMKLRYPKGHKNEGVLIPNDAETDINRLSNRYDDIFTHPDFYGKYFMDNGRIGLDTSDPKQEFMYLCYKGDTHVDDLSSDKKSNRYLSADVKYEIVSPKKEMKKKKENVSREVKAIKLLAGMEGDEDRMRSIATIMSLPGYSKSADPDGLFILLKDQAAQNEQESAKFGKRTYQERFIELAEMTDGELKVIKDIMLAKNMGIIVSRQDHVLFNGEPIQGLSSDLQIINYFSSPQNQDKYIEMLDLLSASK